MLLKKILLAFAIQVLFFSFAFSTLGDYGISWDEPTHFKRGQGYLWYLLTGENNYNKLVPYNLLRAQTDSSYHERSIYQDDKHNASFYRTIDGGHPPFADILSSLTNMIFYQKLGWLGDVESYHLFEIFVASLGVTFLFLLVYESFGLIAALFSVVFFATYPLFWSESHFNIKDPIETSWIIITLYFLWKGFKNYSLRFFIFSSVFAGFALGTKFNVVFLPVIVLPWVLFLITAQKKEIFNFIKSKKTLITLIFCLLIPLLIFYISYPFLWENPITNIGKVLTYYQREALDPAFANAVLSNWKFYALKWVLFTTPPLILLGLLLSLVFIKKILFKHNSLILLTFCWLIVTLFRVSWPGINIYGGVRQIMEYIPAISILAGVGLTQILTRRGKIVLSGVFIITAIFSVIPLIKLHPNENLYFNFLVEGLKGAIESDIPAAGNSFGNAYYPMVKWLNANTPQGAKLTLVQGSPINIPRYKLRSDIDLSGDYFSGIQRGGEYIMELTFNYEHKQNFYAWEYVDKFLEPVFEVKVDGVALAKVWKNDLENTKLEYRLNEKRFDEKILAVMDKQALLLELNKEVVLSRMVLSFDLINGCSLPSTSVVDTSLNNKDWFREKDPLAFAQVGIQTGSFKPAWESSSPKTLFSPLASGVSKQNKEIAFYFAGRKAKFIRINLDNGKSCMLNNPRFEVVQLNEN